MLASVQSVAVDVARLAIWLALLSIVFMPLERLVPERRQPVLRRQFRLDLGYYFINGLFTVALLTALTAMLAMALQHLVPRIVTQTAADLPLWQRILATLAVGEFGFYWGHRWSHEVPLLWRFHAVHHSAEAIDWLTNTRAHPVDMVFTRLCGFVLIYLTGLGQPGTGAGGLAPGLLVVFSVVWGFFIHANLRWRFGWLEYLIATPGFHRWHHTNDANRDRNYASTLPVYDWLFRTLHLPRHAVAPAYGIDAPIAASLVDQLVDPVMPANRGVRPTGNGAVPDK